MIDLNDPEARKETLGKMYASAIAEMTEFRTTMAKLLTAFVTIQLLFTGWAVSTQAKIGTTRQLLLASGILIVTVIALYLTRAFQQYFLDIAGVITRIDHIHGAFEVGRYIEGKALYPEHWLKFGQHGWREPVFHLSYVALSIMGCFSILVVVAVL